MESLTHKYQRSHRSTQGCHENCDMPRTTSQLNTSPSLPNTFRSPLPCTCAYVRGNRQLARKPSNDLPAVPQQVTDTEIFQEPVTKFRIVSPQRLRPGTRTSKTLVVGARASSFDRGKCKT